MVHRVNRWVRCSRLVRQLLLVGSMCRRCLELITRTTCSRFVHSRDGPISNRSADQPSLAVVSIFMHCHITYQISVLWNCVQTFCTGTVSFLLARCHYLSKKLRFSLIGGGWGMAWGHWCRRRGRGGMCLPKIPGKIFFMQLLCKIWLFWGKHHVNLGILLIFRANIKILVFW